MLTALRTYAGTGVPVFGVNFGEIGFLAAVDREDARRGARAGARGRIRGAVAARDRAVGAGTWIAINDVSIHRQPGKRVADLAYAVGTDEVGRVRCDGLVVATPAGSTGYNLANGGPVMAWGVEGFVVSFIAPHSLTARSLVVAPADRLSVVQPLAGRAGRRHRRRPAGVHARAGRARRGAVRRPTRARSPRCPGTTFYQRLREKFGRLATATVDAPRGSSRSARRPVRARVVHSPCSTSCASRTCC